MNTNLTEGKIFGTLLRLALPIAGVQVMNMAYNITDMFWLGRVSSYALAASGVAGLFLWMAVGLLLIGRVGAEIGVSQARGRGEIGVAYKYSRTALYISAVLGTVYALFVIIFSVHLIGFFNFQEAHVAADAVNYLSIIVVGTPAVFMASSIDGTFLASGNSKTPFIIGSGGVIFNMILTPLFIFGLDLGVIGAAASSVIAQYSVLFVRLWAVKYSKNRPFEEYKFVSGIRKSYCSETVRHIFKLTWPICLENTLFPLLTMIITRFEVSFGAFAVSMGRVVTQVESLSWLVGAGFGASITAFVGQNFGAGKMDRVEKSVKYSFCFMAFWGLMVMGVLWFGGEIIFATFFPEYLNQPEKQRNFITILRIVSFSQIFINLEFAAANAFRGKGRTLPPSVINIVSNVIRVPMAYFLSITFLGLFGIWVAASFAAILRGAAGFIWYKADSRRH